MKFVSWSRYAVALVVAVCVIKPLPAAADLDAAIDAVASEILEKLESQGGRVTRLNEAGQPRVALWPYRAGELPIGVGRARDINAALRRALAEKSGGAYVFKEREGLERLIDELDESDVTVDDPIAAVRRNATADILITGAFTLHEDRLDMRFTAVGLRAPLLGTIVAQTGPQSVAWKQAYDLSSLEVAVAAMAADLKAGAPDMAELRRTAVHYQASGVQPPFGAYVEGLIVTAIENAYRDPLTGRALRVNQAEIADAELRRIEGAPLSADRQRPERFDTRAGVYVLGGSYWELGNVIELRAWLRNARGVRVSTTRYVPRREARGIALLPISQFAELRRDELAGPVRLRLSSSRSRDPVYRIGEKLVLLLETDRDAWVHCYYLQADGQLLKIFPNRYEKSGRLRGGGTHVLPGQTSPFDLPITEPVGTELVKCFAAERDVTAQLPIAVRGLDGGPLANATARQLRVIYGRLDGARATEASLVVNVER